MTSVFEDELTFSSDLGRAQVLREVKDHRINDQAVVVNLAGTDAFIGRGQRSALPAFSSTIIREADVTGDLLMVISAGEIGDQLSLARRLGWADFYGGDTGRPVLLRSTQDVVGQVVLNTKEILRHPGLASTNEPFVVKANLWFSPAGTACGIHNRHDFIEIHTQISGRGRMQKFVSADPATLYEEQLMSPGTTFPVPFCTQEGNTFAYPWHQYQADTDCVWLALEYHRI